MAHGTPPGRHRDDQPLLMNDDTNRVALDAQPCGADDRNWLTATVSAAHVVIMRAKIVSVALRQPTTREAGHKETVWLDTVPTTHVSRLAGGSRRRGVPAASDVHHACQHSEHHVSSANLPHVPQLPVEPPGQGEAKRRDAGPDLAVHSV
jgi:hypothetical protein